MYKFHYTEHKFLFKGCNLIVCYIFIKPVRLVENKIALPRKTPKSR